MAKERLEITIEGKSTGFKKASEEAGKSLSKLTKDLQSLGQTMTSIGTKMSIAVTAPLVLVGKKALDMAMDVVESENLFEVSMGKMAEAARKWSEEFSKSLGLNQYAVREQIGTFNVMLTSMGIAEEQAYEMSKALVQLTYDMSSFYNLPVEEAFRKLQSGITGEIEPLKRLGIVVNETTVKTYAYTHGIAKQGEELTESQKILSRYGAIMEATSKAQGDMARTLESPANQLRIFKEQVNLLLIDLGKQLIPVFQDVMKVAKNLVEWFSNLSDTQKKWLLVVGGVSAAVGPTLLVMGQLITAALRVKKAFEGATAAVSSFQVVSMGLLKDLGPIATALGLQAQGVMLNKQAFEGLESAYIKVAEVSRDLLDATATNINNIKQFQDVIPGAYAEVQALAQQLDSGVISAQDFADKVALIASETIRYRQEGIEPTSFSLQVYEGAQNGATLATEEGAEAIQEQKDAVVDLNEKFKDLIETLFGVFNKNQATTKASWRYQDAMKALNEKVSEGITKGREYQEALFNAQDATEDYIQKIWEEYSAEGTSIVRKKELQNELLNVGLKAVETGTMSKDAFIVMAGQFGLSSSQIIQKADEMGLKLDYNTRKRILELDNKPLLDKANEAKQALDGVKDKEVTLGVKSKGVDEAKKFYDWWQSLPNTQMKTVIYKLERSGYKQGGLIGAQAGLYATGGGALPVLIHPPEVILNPKQALNLVWAMANKKVSQSSQPSIVQNINITSSAQLSESEIRRQLDLLSRQLANRLGIA